ncbi:MAG: DUF998 domain-containing protein [Flavobacteriaceae bacterium]|nr:DUF998 domain-containing protein [Flavobacteriaceae bacterium]
MMNNKTVYLIGIFGVTFFGLASILGGFQFDDYNQMSQFISESMAIDTPYGKIFRYFGYIPSGILIAIFSFVGFKKLPKSKLIKTGFIGLGVFYGIGTIIVGLFPCDSGCGSELVTPSISQIIHNLTGMLTYLFVPISLLLIGVGLQKLESYKKTPQVIIIFGSISVLFVGILLTNLTSHFIGLYQRIIEISFIISIVVLSILIRNQKTS